MPAQTHATRMLELIQAQLEGRAVDGIDSATIGGKQISKIPLMELKRLEQIYRAEVKAEERAERIALGLGAPSKTIGVRFTAS